MNFLQLVQWASEKYQSKSDLIIFEIIFHISKKVKNKIQFTENRKSEIDFTIDSISQLLDDYYVRGKPLSHITGNTTFNGVILDVHKGVLAPRSETELLCDHVTSILQNDHNLIHCADLCCGSGNIAISIKKKCNHIKMTGIDIDKKAVNNTLHNIKKNDVEINVIQGDFYQTMIDKNLRFDVIISNPPYVSDDELERKMLKYEDKKCFSNSIDDLFFYQILINNYQKIFRDAKHFLLALEIGYNQKNRIMELLKKQGLLTYTTFYQDLNKHDRVVIIYRN